MLSHEEAVDDEETRGHEHEKSEHFQRHQVEGVQRRRTRHESQEATRIRVIVVDEKSDLDFCLRRERDAHSSVEWERRERVQMELTRRAIDRQRRAERSADDGEVDQAMFEVDIVVHGTKTRHRSIGIVDDEGLVP